MTKEEIVLLISQANNSVGQAINFLKENSKAFHYMDLKIHEASWYCCNLEDDVNEFPLCVNYPISSPYDGVARVYSFFEWFCIDAYRNFKDNLENDHGIKFEDMLHYINQTSSFYLHKGDLIDIARNGIIDYDYTIENFISYYIGDALYFSIENGRIDLDLDSMEDYDEGYLEIDLDIIEDIKKYIVRYVKDYSEDILIVYKTLKNFKDNQVEEFKDYLRDEEERIKEQLEEEERERKEAQDKVDSLVTKYSMEENDLKELVDNYSVANSK